VTLSDVKYGNVLVVGDEPGFCDFDRATVFPWNTWRCVREREVDRDLFNYCFGGGLLSERAFRAATMDLARLRPDLFSARVYYGAGYASERSGAWSRGSGRWYLVRAHLPALAGKTVLDLGCREGLTSLGMLRAGARRVIAYEPDPVMARYARLNHQWFDFVENRAYGELEVLDGSACAIASRFPDGFDLATAFDGLPGDGPQESAELVRLLSTMVECLVVRASQHSAPGRGAAGRRSSVDVLKDLLLTNGFPELEVVGSLGGPPMLIGRRVGHPTPSGVATPATV
jgi:hypothetical protein